MVSYIKEKLPDIIIFVILLIIGIKISYGSERFTDISYYDESMYLTKGVNFEIFGRAYRDGYNYFLWYKVLSFFAKDNIGLYFLNNTLLLLLPSLVLYLLMRTMKINLLIAFLGSVVFLLSSVNIFDWPFITKFVLLIMLSGFIVLYKLKKPGHRLIFSVFLSAVLMYTRPEYVLTFGILSTMFIIHELKNVRKERFQQITAKAAFLLTIFLLIYRFNPVSRQRADLAFTQHYVKDINNRNGPDRLGLSNYDAVLSGDFGEKVSMLGALKNNPKLFTEHVWYNFVRLKDNFVQIVPYRILEKRAGVLIIISEMVFIIAALFSVYALARRIMRKGFGLFSLIYLIFLLPTVISVFIYYPRAHYLIIFIALWLVYFCYELSHALSNIKILKSRSFLLAVTAGLAIMYLVPFRSHGKSIHDSSCTNLKTLRFLIGLNIKEEVNFFNVGSGMQTYIGDNWNYKSAELIDSTFEDFVNKNQINVIIVNNLTFLHKAIKDDSDFQRTVANIDFERQEIPDCTSYVLIKKNLLR